MTKKDYELIATVIKGILPLNFTGTISSYYRLEATREEKRILDSLVDGFAVYLKQDNVKFDAGKFRDSIWFSYIN